MVKRLLFALCLACHLGAQAAPNAWPTTARADLAFIDKTLRDNHPGSIDEQNPAFGQWLERGREQALASADALTSQAGYQQWVERYLEGFADAGLTVSWKAAKDIPKQRPPASVTMAEVAQSVYWISVHGASATGQSRQIATSLPDLRTADTIVFDLRGDRGGDLAPARQALDTLYGEDYLDMLHRGEGPLFAEWRVSAANLEHLTGRHTNYTMEVLADKMAQALTQGGTFVAQSKVQPNPKKGYPRRYSTARPVLLTDSQCKDACLDFADRIMRLPGARHVGHTTGSASAYLAPRQLELPGKHGALSFAQAVWRGRKRGHNVALTPVAAYPGSMADDTRVRDWVLANLR